MHLQAKEGQRTKITSKHRNLKGKEGSSLILSQKYGPVDTLIPDIQRPEQ